MRGEAAYLREKLARQGVRALSDAELIAVVLGMSSERAAVVARERCGQGREAALEEYARRRCARDSRPVIDNARAAITVFPPEMVAATKEHFLVYCLSARRQLLSIETISVGTLTASLVHPREVFAPAIIKAASAIIAAHNHPSGDPEPSSEDHEATRRLVRAGELLGIPLLDHVVVSAGSYCSFRERGLI